jgi:hypothetical protein
MKGLVKILGIVCVTMAWSCSKRIDCNTSGDVYTKILVEDSNHVLSLSRVPFIIQGDTMFAKISNTQIVAYDLCSGIYQELIDLKSINTDSLAEYFFSDLAGILKPSSLEPTPPLSLISTDLLLTKNGFSSIVLLSIPSEIIFRGYKATLINRYPLMLDFHDKEWIVKSFDYQTEWDSNQTFTWFDYTGGMLYNEGNIIMNGFTLNKTVPKLCYLSYDKQTTRFLLRDSLVLAGLPSKFSSQTSSGIDRMINYIDGLILTRQHKIYAYSVDAEKIKWELDLDGYVHDIVWSVSSNLIYALSEVSYSENQRILILSQVDPETGVTRKIDTLFKAEQVLGARIFDERIHLISIDDEFAVYNSKSIDI